MITGWRGYIEGRTDNNTMTTPTQALDPVGDDIEAKKFVTEIARKAAEQAIAATIERCAQVLIKLAGEANYDERHRDAASWLIRAASAIRALKGNES